MPGVGKGISYYFRAFLPLGDSPFYFANTWSYTYGYSLRKLHPDATNAIRVRRDSDNTEQDIGFVYYGIYNQYILDTDTLLSFVGAGSGFVTIWYHQNGVNHLIQSTQANQPRIVSSGVVDTVNGLPAMLFDGTNDRFAVTSSISDSQPWSAFQASKRAAANQMAPLLSGTAADAPYTVMEYTDNFVYLRDNANTMISSGIDTSIDPKIWSGIFNGSSGTIWKNGSTISLTGPFASGGVGDFNEFGRRESIVYSNGYCSEFIFFNSDQAASSVAIQNNMADFSGIYMSSNRTQGYTALIVGQSNGTDRFNQSALPGAYTSPIPDGWTFFKSVDNSTDNGIWERQDAGINTTTGGGVAGNFAWSFTASYRMKAAYQKALYVIPTCVGGTGLDNSFSPGWDPTHVNEYYDRSVTNANQGFAKLSNVTTEKVLIIDHGQADASSATPAANYETNLTNWINSYRTDFALPNMKVVLILLNTSSIYTHTATVRTAQENVAANVSNVFTIDGNDYPLQDGEHYTNAAAVQLGTDIADLISTF